MGHSLGVAMLGGNPLDGRKAHDFYATPVDVTLALLAKIGPRLRGPVAEPACGDGAICRVLEARGLRTIPTDLHDRGYGGHGGGHDLLAIDVLPADEIITNPPFDIAPKVIDRIMGLKPRVFALLLKGTFWHAKSRLALWERYPPAAVYPLTWRPDFENKGRPTLEMCWTVWDADHLGPTVYEMLPRPEGHGPQRRVRADPRPRRLKVVAPVPPVPQEELALLPFAA
jgi:hypothetical protein